MELVDTHCHLDFPDYKDDLDEVLKRSASSGVVRFIVPGTSIESTRAAVKLAEKYAPVFAAAGIHPHEADKAGDPQISELRDIALKSDKLVAIGEIGLDYYKGYSDPENQRKLFKRCLAIARDLDFPVILHNRNAGEDLVNILKESDDLAPRGVVHCFSGDAKLAKDILDLGMYVSFAGNITFEKADKLRGMIKEIPPDRLLLETDAPYISPEPLRGKRNEPGNVKYLLEVYASAYGRAPEDIAEATTLNANRLFRLGLKGGGKIAYAIRDSLYINVTNRCTNRCTFCVRYYSSFVKGHNLRLDKDPSAEEIIDAIGDVSRYNEIVFCGYGEPTLRLGIVKEVAAYVKKAGGRLRMVTNGEGDMINGRVIANELKGLIDRVSVSLNEPEPEKYDKLCRSVFGETAHGAILDFIKNCRANGIGVEVTCLDMVGEEDVSECRRMAQEMGASFRLRYYDAVG